ncbi:hypothetical protein FR483_N559R [Paramecium bursaria Chlorella virus FR483]|uniref:Uncharacterized protein N559R n=1 Tax=Paramecium bursaria Chlorella virus FR483 TaxID=399781 RepID=A7J7R3_PBCVF|nr:homing endonuclease [Paramecium bursaria Chlorella virus FR483]ABT15844.1 hypothetical protein FR483_N559R [Paramecium bursaria Chlorella virus FR483]
MGFIYKLTYKKSGKAYIGQTIRPIHKRLEEHQLPNSECVAISRAIQKYGWENFDKEWYEVPNEDLNFYEEMLVALLGTLSPDGYNLKEGGGSSGKLSEESKQKMSKARIGKTHTDETKQKMSEAQLGEKHYNYGKTLSEDHKKKISEAQLGEKHYNYGRTLSEKTRQKISKAHDGKTLSGEIKQKISKALTGKKNHFYGKTHDKKTRQKISKVHSGKTLTEDHKKKLSETHIGQKNHMSKKVYQYTTDGTYIGWFASVGEAARYINKSSSSIRRCARDAQKTAHGFKWSYIEL